MRLSTVFAVSGMALLASGAGAPGSAQLLDERPAAPQLLAQAKPSPTANHKQLAEKINDNTVTIISGNPNGTLLYLAYDLSAVLDKDGEIRILPVVGKGAYQNVVDVLHLRGVDLGITQSNIVGHLRRTNEMGPGLDRRLAYITQLYAAEMHILAGAGVDKVEDLNGKKVNFSDAGSGTQFATRQIFGLLNVKAEEVNLGQRDAYLKVRSGEIAATIITAGKPVDAFAKFKLEPGMKLLPVPYADALTADFFPAVLSSSDYPNLMAPNTSIETISFGIILVAYNWPKNTERYRRLAGFVDSFFSNFEKFQEAPRHPKWRDTNLAATLPGWTRFPAAEEWLKRKQAETQATGPTGPTGPTGLDPVMARRQAAREAPNDPVRQEQLFRRFIEWNKKQTTN